MKAGMREYRALLAANADTRPAETAILFYAGWLGHYVADGSQPLHVTIQVQRMDWRESERVYDGSQDSLPVRDGVCDGKRAAGRGEAAGAGGASEGVCRGMCSTIT